MFYWINKNKAWIFSGIGVAIVGYFIRTHLLDDTSKVRQLGIGKNVNNINTSDGDPYIAGRDVNVSNHYGISEDKFQEIAKNLVA